MSKAVLISIQPKWCELIASGKKTVEVRKTKPKLDTPFKVYIYCTDPRHYVDKYHCYSYPKNPLWLTKNGVKTSIGSTDEDPIILNGKVIGEFVCDKIFPISVYYDNPNCKLALKEFPYVCLTDKQIIDYLGNGKQGYGWHISDLKIYDKPKELSEFTGFRKTKFGYEPVKMQRPPQSWCCGGVERMSNVSMIDGHIDEQMDNCHGCKWLDENKSQGRGNGYCCHVVLSKTQSEKVRRPEMSRCELYKAGDFATRWETEENIK